MARRKRARVTTGPGDDTTMMLADPECPMWHDFDRYRRWMTFKGWSMPSRDRVPGGGSAHPSRRRQAAAAGWAAETGNCLDERGRVSWHQLRALGFID